MVAAYRRARPPHLIRRGDTFYLRIRVPRDLIERLGLTEVRRSLHVGRLADARLTAPLLAMRVKEAFQMIQQNNLTRDASLTLINRCFLALAGEADRGYVPDPLDPDYEREFQRAASASYAAELQAQVAAGQVSQAQEAVALRQLEQVGLNVASFSDDERRRIVMGVVRAQIEQQRIFQFRLDEAVLPYQPADPLFRTNDNGGVSAVGPTVGELKERYETAKRQTWTAKTMRSNLQKLGLLEAFFGPDRVVSTIRPEEVYDFAEKLLRLARNHHVGASKTFQGRQTDAIEQRVSPKTARLALECCKAMFRWACPKFIATNPAQGVSLEVPKAKKGEKPRRPFTSAELKRLFGAAPFTGRQSPRRPWQAGPLQMQDAYFWVPILGFYTGMRLGEIVQLHLNDVDLAGPIPFIRVAELGGGEIGSGTEKHVKSNAGLRLVPLHPDLMGLGFAAFVKRRRKDHKAKKRLFWEIGFGADGQASTLFSKWFGRLLDQRDLSDPGLVFHSFRHGMEDAFRNVLTPQYVIDQIIGHADGKTSGEYGEGVGLNVAYDAVKALKLSVSIPVVIDESLAMKSLGSCGEINYL